jgi:hypothetical protein
MAISLTSAPCKVNRDPRIYGMRFFEKIPRRNLDEKFCNPSIFLFNKYTIWTTIPLPSFSYSFLKHSPLKGFSYVSVHL